MDLELAVDPGQVVLDRLGAQEEAGSDVAVGQAFCDEEHDLQFLGCQPFGGRRVARL
jgi:hypothetical protein